MSPSSLQIGVTLAFFQFCSKAPDLRDLFIKFPNGIELYGVDYLNKTRSMPNISLLDLLGRDPGYVLISSLDISLKRKLWMLFGPFQKQLLLKFWNFVRIFLLILAKRWLESFTQMSQVICECLFLPGTSCLISDPIFGVISAECMNINVINVISLLDNTRYFIP